MSDGILQLFLRSASESSGSGEGHGSGGNHTHEDGGHGTHGRGTVLFLFTAFAVGGQQATPTNRRCTSTYYDTYAIFMSTKNSSLQLW